MKYILKAKANALNEMADPRFNKSLVLQANLARVY